MKKIIIFIKELFGYKQEKASLTIIAAINPYFLNFNHNVTFQISVYGIMLVLWFFWIKKFSKTKTRE